MPNGFEVVQKIIEKMARKVVIGTRLLNDVVNDGQVIVWVSRLSTQYLFTIG